MQEPIEPVNPDTETKSYRMAIRKPVTMVMVFLTVVVFGWRSYQQLPVNLMPDISYPTLTVRTEYEGAAPEDVEKLVSRPLEEMLSIVGGLVEISSISSPGLSEIMLEFTWGTDMNVAQQDVRDRLDIFNAPDEVTEKPVILRYDPSLDPVIRLAITGPASTDLGDDLQDAAKVAEARAVLTTIRDAAERHVKSDLEAKAGIAQVEVKGGQEQEIQILVDAQQLKGLGLTLENVSTSLAQQNINLSGGRLEEGKTEYLVRTLNEFQTVEEIGQSIISTPTGGQFRLLDVAEVFLGEKERESVVRINGREAVALDIFKEGDANTVEVCNMTKDLLGFKRELSFTEKFQRDMLARIKAADQGMLHPDDQKKQDEAIAAGEQPAQPDLGVLSRLPDDAEIVLISDQSRFINSAIAEVQDAAVTGGLLALLVLFLFLKELKSTIIIGLTIPISVLATFVPMYMFGIGGDVISLNIMSLGGLALGIGNLVDNAIVVLESIFRCREEGDSVVDAAERGTKEVAGAVTSSTFTTVAVFFPVAFVEGIAGQLFRDLALTVTFSQVASLLVALTLIPLVASRQGAHVEATRSVIWILSAYRESRDLNKRSVLQSILLIVPIGMRYLGEYFRTSTADTFGSSVRNAGGASGAMGRVLGPLSLLVLIPVYLLQLVLQLLQLVAVTLLFFVAALLYLAFVVLRIVMNILLWLPLRIFDLFFDAMKGIYKILLINSLRFAPVVLLGAVALGAHAIYSAQGIGSELVPPMKQGEFGIRMEASAGTRLEETEGRARRIEKLLRAMPEVMTVTAEIGQEESGSQSSESGENVAEFTVLLHNPEQAAKVQDQLIEKIRNEIQTFATEEITFTLPSMFSFKTAVEIQIVGDDLKVLKEVGAKSLLAVQEVEGVEDAELSVKQGYPEVIIELDRELLASKGITPGQVAQALRTEVQGDVATKFSTFGEKIDMRVRTNQRLLQSVDDLRKVSVAPGPNPIPLESVARIIVEEGPSEIRRVDQRQVVLISANSSGRDLASVSKDILAAVESVPRPREYYFVAGGQLSELETTNNSLLFAMALAIFLVYVVMACEFESFLDPLLVMFSIPLAFVGVIYAMLYTQTDLSIMVFLGGIILVGIVTNNAIVLVDYINILRRRGYKKREAVIEAGAVRLRPILMTMITTVLGLVPMVLGSGDGAELRRPLAITLMAGLFCATMLTLIIIPAVYELFGGRDKPEAPA